MNSVFNIRWPDTGLVSRLKVLALANRRSLQAEVLVALERHVALVLPAVAPEAVSEDLTDDPAPTDAELIAAFDAQTRPLDAEDAVERVRGYELPSAVQVAKRPFKPDFK